MKGFSFIDRLIVFTSISLLLAAAAALSRSDVVCGESLRGACGAVNKSMCSESF